MRRQTGWWVVVLASLAACRSGGNGAGDGDANVSDHVPGDHTGPASPDAAEGPGSLSAMEVCRAAIRVQCERMAVCQGNPIDDCVRFANPCPDYYFNQDSNRTVAGIAACVGPLGARTCSDLALGLFPSCFVGGNRPEGAGCAYPSQCRSGTCGGGSVCEVCRAGDLPLGGSCAGAGCRSGGFCHNGVCVAASAITYATEGQPCDLGATPVVGCTGDLLCITSQSAGSAGTCLPAPGAGLPCAISGFSGRACAPGTVCTSPSGGTCVALGSCGSGPPCDATTYCKLVDGGFACVPLGAAGQPCGSPAAGSGTPSSCIAPAICYFPLAKCVVLRAQGGTCDANNPCDGLLSCVAGICQPLGSANCPANPGDGGAG